MSKINVRIETSEMKRALDVAGSVINRKVALPILGCVVLRWDKERKVFQMLASNSEQFLRMDCTSATKDGERQPWLVMIEQDRQQPFAECAVSHATLREAFATLPTMPCLATIDTEKATLEVNYQTGRFSIPIEASTDGFPTMPAVAKAGEAPQVGQSPLLVSLTTDAQPLLQTMTQATVCSASDELRPVMNTVCLDLHHDSQVIVASDGHSLFKHQKDTGVGYLSHAAFGATESATVLVPKQVLPMLSRAFAGAQTLTLAADQQRVEFSTEGVVLTSVLIEGRFPNYNSVIPQNNPHHIVLGRSELMAALRRVQVFAADASNMVVMKRDGEHLLLSAQDYDFSRQADERVTIANADDTSLPQGFEIGCKIATLLSLLQTLTTDDVRLSLAEPSRAFLIRPEDAKAENITLLQMPMLIEEKK